MAKNKNFYFKLFVSYLISLITQAVIFSSCSDKEILSFTSANSGETVNYPNDNLPVNISTEGNKFYYAFDEKIYLNEVANKIVVSFEEKYLPELQQFLQANDIIHQVELFHFGNGFILTTQPFFAYPLVSLPPPMPDEIKALMEDLKKQTGVKSVHPMYSVSGLEMAVTDEFVVQFKKNVSQQEIDELHKKHQVKIIKITELYQLLSVSIDFDALDVANAYQESGLTIYSHPDFVTSVNTF